MRNRLIELLEEENGFSRYITADERRERIADHLIANGVVIIDPVKYPPVTNRDIIDQVMGTPLDEMAGLIKAKQEGRIIIPPCKVGDKIYQTDGIRIYESTVNEVTYTTNKVIYCTENICFDETAIDKSIFLTKKEAEKALAERSNR